MRNGLLCFVKITQTIKLIKNYCEMRMKPLLQLNHLTIELPKGAEREKALEDVSYALHQNEILCLVGESGSGKSLSIRTIMQLLPSTLKVTQGEVLFNGQNLLELTDKQMRTVRGEQIGMVFQEPMTSLNPLMTIGKQVAEMFVIHHRTEDINVKDTVIDLFKEVGLPDPKQIYNKFPHQLSGGQRQRVVIAMALALEPKILLADEPTTALDVTTQKQVLQLIKSLQRKHGTGVIFITHDFGVVAEIADRVIVLKEGQIVESGSVQQILNHAQHPYTQKLIAAVPKLTFGRDNQHIALTTAFKVENLNKTYRTSTGSFFKKHIVKAVDQISFSIKAGETLGIVGESGSGKSSLARLSALLMDGDSGDIYIHGKQLNILTSDQLREARRELQVVFQDPYGSLNPRKKIMDILVRGPLAHGDSYEVAVQKAKKVIVDVGLSVSALQRYPHEFSGGQRQRIAIARALILEPKVLIADEPVSALDVSIQQQILTLLRDIQKKLNLAILFITHDLRVASSICDKIAVMQKGKIVELSDTRTIFTSPKHSYTRQLISAIPGDERLQQDVIGEEEELSYAVA